MNRHVGIHILQGNVEVFISDWWGILEAPFGKSPRDVFIPDLKPFPVLGPGPARELAVLASCPRMCHPDT